MARSLALDRYSTLTSQDVRPAGLAGRVVPLEGMQRHAQMRACGVKLLTELGGPG